MSISKRQKIVIFLCSIFVIWMERKSLVECTNVSERLLEFLFFICMTTVLSALFLFLLKGIRKNNDFLKYYFILFIVQMIAMLPLYTQNFMYGDDLWGFSENYSGNLSDGLFFSSPFIDFLKGTVLDTSFQSIKYFRLYNGLVLFMFGCMIFYFVYNQTQKKNLALFFSTCAIAGCSAVDCIAYASIFPINMALVASAVSFILYSEAHNECVKKKGLLFCASAVSLFTAFCLYQIGTTIVFVMYVIYEKYREKTKESQRFTQAFLYMIYYAIVTLSYLFITKIFQIICGVNAGQGGRSQIVFSLEQIVNKLVWFLKCVCPQTINRILGLLLGNSIYIENNMFYNCSFKYPKLGILLSLLVVALMLLSIIYNGIKQKSGIYVFIAIIAIPLSFWPFLVLPESYYLTYYATGIIFLFIWYVCDGVMIVGKHLLAKIKDCYYINIEKTVIVFVSLFIIAIQSNNYAENAWVNYCRDSYEYIANTLAIELRINPNVNSISIQGSVSPYVGGREYVIFEVKDILKELGYNSDDFIITQNDSLYYISIFNDGEVSQMMDILGEAKMDQLLQYYDHDDLYSRWCYNGKANDENTLQFLQECFISTGQMAVKGENVVVINLDGFNLRNVF